MTQQEFNYILQAAQEGKKDSVYRLAKMYYEGENILQDRVEAKRWFENYVQIGGGRYLGEVTYLLGMMLFNGEDCEQDQIAAIQYFIASYNENYAPARTIIDQLIEGGAIQHFEYIGQQVPLPADVLIAIGKSYLLGENDMPVDHQKALSYLNAVIQDSKTTNMTRGKAFYLLGTCYENGTGVPADYDKAMQYYKDALANHCYEANSSATNLQAKIVQAKAEADRIKREAEAEAERQRKEQEQKDREEKAKQQAEAANAALVAAAEAGDSKSMYRLGVNLIEGKEGFERDTKAGWDWLFKASKEQKNHYADYYIGRAYKNGYHGLKTSKYMAKRYLAKAANAHIGKAAEEYNELLSWKEKLMGKKK